MTIVTIFALTIISIVYYVNQAPGIVLLGYSFVGFHLFKM